MAPVLATPVSVREIASLLGTQVVRIVGNPDLEVRAVVPFRDPAGDGSLSFCEAKEEAVRTLASSTSRVVICNDHRDLPSLESAERAFIAVSHPRLAFMRVLRGMFAGDPLPPGIHPSAVIHPQAQIDPTAHVGPHTVVGRCEVGAHCVIHGNCHLHDDTILGSRVVIHASSVLGGDGFHYHYNEQHELEKFPQLGGVRIDDEVEIGSHSSIVRGTLTDTRVGRGSKIDDFVLIAHTAVIGMRCRVAAGAVIAGNVVIGDDVWIGPGAVISNNLKIGDGASVTMGSAVVADVKPGQKVTGNFAVDHNQFLLSLSRNLRRIPERP